MTSVQARNTFIKRTLLFLFFLDLGCRESKQGNAPVEQVVAPSEHEIMQPDKSPSESPATKVANESSPSEKTESNAPMNPTSSAPISTMETSSVQAKATMKPFEYEGPCPKGMTLVEGGEFTKKQHKSLAKRFENEKIKLNYQVKNFCLAIHEVTVAEFRECVVAGLCDAKYPYYGGRTKSCNRDEKWCQGEEGKYPASGISTKYAEIYCHERGGRLPSLEEWMWAAMGGTEDRRYPWGNQWPTRHHLNICDKRCALEICDGSDSDEEDAKICEDPQRLKKVAPIPGDDGYEELAPVGTYPKGAGKWGQLDLLGNVSEIVDKGGDLYDICGGGYNESSIRSIQSDQDDCVGADHDTHGFRCAAEAKL